MPSPNGNGAVLLGRDITVQLERQHFLNLQVLAKKYGQSPSQLASFMVSHMIEQMVAEVASAMAVEIACRLSGMAR